jgi:hypothetical protein
MIVDGILEGPELGFTSTTHERSLYRGDTIDGALVLVCRQVDDFAVTSTSTAAMAKLTAMINAHATTSSQGIGTSHLRPGHQDSLQWCQPPPNPRPHQAVLRDIHQSCRSDSWLGVTHSQRKRSVRLCVPLSADTATAALMLSDGPIEGTREHSDLEKDVGFNYRQVLGELIYAYAICRLDMGWKSYGYGRCGVLVLTAVLKNHFPEKGLYSNENTVKQIGAHTQSKFYKLGCTSICPSIYFI